MYCAYAIKSDKNKIYIGQTSNLEERLKRHNGFLKNKESSYTHKNGEIWKLIHKEEFLTRKEAVAREKSLKSYQGREFIKKLIDSVG